MAMANTLPEMPRAENNNWQREWMQPCSRLCCHTHPSNCPCADISCDACLESIVRPTRSTTTKRRQPLDRYVCLDCPIKTLYDDTSHWSTQFCSNCFTSAAAPHFGDDCKPHTRWLRIEGATGSHIEIKRSCAISATMAEVTAADLTIFPLSSKESNTAATVDCTKCWCFELSQTNPRASPPGCTDINHGCCLEGCLAQLNSWGRLHYFAGSIPPKTYFCNECRLMALREAEQQAIVAELNDFLHALEISNHDSKVLLEAAEKALSSAPSLTGKILNKSHINEERFALKDIAAKKATLAEWAVYELKTVHAIKPPDVNVHLHEALDARLVEIVQNTESSC